MAHIATALSPGTAAANTVLSGRPQQSQQDATSVILAALTAQQQQMVQWNFPLLAVSLDTTGPSMGLGLTGR